MKRFQRLFSLALAAVLALCTGTAAFASGDFARVSTTLDGMTAGMGEKLSFQVRTEGFYGQGMVIGRFHVTRDGESAEGGYGIDYLETADGPNQGKWLPLLTDYFGPAGSGFPFSSATSEFQVAFHEEGEYRVSISIVDFGDNSIEVCRTEAGVSVAQKPSGDRALGEPDPQETENAASIDAAGEALEANADAINQALKMAQSLARSAPESAFEIEGAPFLLAGSSAAREYEKAVGEAGLTVGAVPYAGRLIVAPVVELDASSIDSIPWTLADALAGKCVFLKLSRAQKADYLFGMKVEKTAGNRVYHTVADMIGLYGE